LVEDLSYLFSTKVDMIFGVMRTYLIVDDTTTFGASGETAEKDWRDTEIREFLEYIVGVIGAVVGSNTCMVSSYDEVCASVVLSHDGMMDGFSRSCVFHTCSQDAHDGSFL